MSLRGNQLCFFKSSMHSEVWVHFFGRRSLIYQEALLVEPCLQNGPWTSFCQFWMIQFRMEFQWTYSAKDPFKRSWGKSKGAPPPPEMPTPHRKEHMALLKGLISREGWHAGAAPLDSYDKRIYGALPTAGAQMCPRIRTRGETARQHDHLSKVFIFVA